ncbi:methyl-accepting chemotaxis protein [Breznakiella homolactica]|uniref:HAMP domain-containing protein n=1 Tax=Breznakiella homolactica TaxID=2798577 RepID=A0A7T7XLW5_9SPIR|nr:methyl-accepting chemotaxis protein [Breznakiella homolactica]QQO08776.1 HAMP domain-containing protein [Breznakiella homolactica]
MKLKFRLSLIVGAIMAVVIAAIAMIILLRSAGLQSAAAYENARNIAAVNAGTIQRRYESYLDSARFLAQIMDSFENVAPAERRGRYNDMIRDIMESNPRYVGIFTVWKPNALDGMDAQYANTPGTDGSGQYISWYTRETGAMEFRAYTDYQAVLDQTQGERILDPIYRTVQGKQTLVVTVIAPVKKNNTVLGAVGVNIDITALQDIVDGIKPYESGVAAVISNNGTMAAHYDHNRTGQNIRDTDRELLGSNFDRVVSSIRTGTLIEVSYFSKIYETDMHVVYYPFTVGESTAPWAIMVGIPMDKVMDPIYGMGQFTIGLALAAILLVAAVIFLVSLRITKPIVSVAAMLKDISEGEGDLTKRISLSSKDEIGDMAHYFNLTLDKIKGLIVAIKNQSGVLFDIAAELSSNMTETAAAVNQITANIQGIKTQAVNQSASVTETNSTMEQITVNIDKLNNHIENQSASVAESSSAVEEMLANIQSVTQTLVKNTDNVQNLADASEVGRTGLQEVSADIREIARESEGLLEINAVMENIASQTNLLSMNAAIEAAHAGDAGKGFAVVADEIRKLAESSGEQSKTISAVLKKIKESIDKITKSTDAVLSKFEAIDSGVRTVSDQEENIRNAMEEQGAGSKQILDAISQLNNITQMVKGGSEEMLTGSNEVIRESQNLEMVTQQITDGINEMASGAEQINSAVNQVNTISGQNKTSIDMLVAEVSKFKVE